MRSRSNPWFRDLQARYEAALRAAVPRWSNADPMTFEENFMQGTYVVVVVARNGAVVVHGVYDVAHVEREKFDMWAWKKRCEEVWSGTEVHLFLQQFEIKPSKGWDGVERFYLPSEPLKPLKATSSEQER